MPIFCAAHFCAVIIGCAWGRQFLCCAERKSPENQDLVRATDGARTRDLHLGKVAYYQLYYCRTYSIGFPEGRATDGARTRDLHLGKVAYYQLYYCRIISADI